MSVLILATLASALLTNAILFFSQRRKDRIAWAALSDKSNWAKLRRELEAAFAFCDENYGQMKQPRRPSAMACRARFRQSSRAPRRATRRTARSVRQLGSGLLATRSVVIPTRLKGFPDSDGWVQVIDDRLPSLSGSGPSSTPPQATL